jgi:D-alanine--poly(phosphoribitol) ligase subunit 1
MLDAGKTASREAEMTNVLEYLENSARECPDRTAVSDPQTSCTYRAFACGAKRLGSALLACTRPRQPVAVCMEKSVFALQAMMGAVYAGCFYVYIDPSQAPARFRQILSVCRPACVVTDRPELAATLGADVRVLNFEELARAETDEEALAIVRAQALDTDPLYCNFTSGSTGVPKGVLVSHRSVIDFMNYFPALFGITGEDVLGNQAPFDFDVSVKDIYSAFKTSAALVLIPRKYFSVVTVLLDYLCERRVTTLIWAVSALCLVAQFKGLGYRVPERVDKILFSGELMPVKYLQQWQAALPGARFVNLYGPTEITCNCTYYQIARAFGPGEQIPIGRAFPNEKVFLLDEKDREITQADLPGELCVSGTALALGYYRNDEQTRRAFVQNPLNPDYPETIYRTGDLARYDGDGNLLFAGRRDFQIKFMGHRIELEEIEAALNSVPAVRRACCCFSAEENRIVGFYCGGIEAHALKKALYELLPVYMIPAELHMVGEIPLTPNGKMDRKRLMVGRTERHGSEHA